MSGAVLREAAAEDAARIAEVHVRSWQWAYRGQVPDELLNRLQVEPRVEWWREAIADPDQGVWVAEMNGRIVGFASTSRSRDHDAAPTTGELLTIYLEEDAAGLGVGHALLGRAVEGMKERGFHTATLWVLESNDRARRFYERAGWKLDGRTKSETWGDFEAREVRYRTELDR